MSDMNIAVEGSLSKASSRGINKADVVWMLGLYGTAIGAGVLFLPINAGVGGLWPLVAMLILALLLTFFAHRGLTRFCAVRLHPVTATSPRWWKSTSARPQAVHHPALLLRHLPHPADVFSGHHQHRREPDGAPAGMTAPPVPSFSWC